MGARISGVRPSVSRNDKGLWPVIISPVHGKTPQNSKYQLEGKILHQQCNRLFPARCQTYAN